MLWAGDPPETAPRYHEPKWAALPSLGVQRPWEGEGLSSSLPHFPLGREKGKQAELALEFIAKSLVFGIARKCIYVGIVRN